MDMDLWMQYLEDQVTVKNFNWRKKMKVGEIEHFEEQCFAEKK